ncbi:MAG: AsmA-like C-terminal domain-containing protein [Desulfobulbaceae bacterium]|jgi:hypothetical protein|nr:AsmA-like C-terminal domain-containing protein [Desulfobulbaceae bacterium]
MKKKISYIVFAFFALLLAIVVALPFIIETKKVQQQIIQRIEHAYSVDAELADVQISFFPTPHIELLSLTIQHKDFSLTIPEVVIYPSWRILIGQPEVGRIYATQPQFALFNEVQINQDSEQTTFPLNLDSIPRFTLHINDGSLQLPAITSESGTINDTYFTEINAKASARNNIISVSWDSLPSFGEGFDLEASLSLPDLTSHGEISVNQIDLAKLWRTSKKLPISFITDTSDFSTTFHYSPQTGLSLHFNGDIPDFTLTGPDLGDQPPVPILINNGAFNISARKDFLEIAIESLHVAEPALQLTGSCSYYLPKTGVEKHVKIELQGENIDATMVRQKILALVGSNIVAETVCNIVQNGYANSASYSFDSPIADFKDINAMTLDVDIDRADIHLKYVPIDLENASGKIRIKDGDLTGWDITTEVKGSSGTEGSFLVGLAKNNWGLRVDVDINANLSELPQILREIITEEDVVEELHLLTATGRGDAHLHIGDDLNDFKVIVDVTQYANPEIRYERISWPITPQKGQLQISDSAANWSNLSLQIGNHVIRETSGHISWKDPSIPFELTSLTGIFDINTMLTELKSYETLNGNLHSVATSVIGSTRLDGQIKGNLFAPEDYAYNFDAQLKDVTIMSPLLPGKMSLVSARAKVTDTTIAIHETTGAVLDNTFQMQGNLTHADWMDWYGELIFNGELQPPLMAWLIQEELLPAKLQLKTPSMMKHLQVKWTEKELLVKGGIQPVATDTTLDFEVTKTEDVLTGDFTIQHSDNSSQVHFVSEPAHNTYEFFITGTLPGQAVTDLLNDSFIIFNTISGKMHVQARFPVTDAPPAFDFSGNLDVKELHLLINNERNTDHTLTFSLTGQDTVLNLNRFNLEVNNHSLAAAGQFKSEGWNGQLKLDIESPLINTDTVEQITDNIDYFIYDRLGITRQSADYKPKYNLDSIIDFNFDTFIVPFGEDTTGKPDDDEYKFAITPLLGQYIFNNTYSSLKISDSMVCGLEIEAFLTWFGEGETRKEVSAQTPDQQVVELRDFLECLNSGTVIEGPMKFKAHAQSNTGEITQGRFSLTSEQGTIHKFAAISKVLSILNIKGWSGSIWQKGYYYNKLELSGFIKDDILQISQFTIDGDGVDIVGQGSFDLDTMEYDMILYVVPFSTVGGLVTKVPIVGRLLGGKEGRIISIPVKITGPAADPVVSILDSSAVGQATGKWIWETVTFPFGWTFEEEKTTPKNKPRDQTEQAIIPQGE